MIKGRSLGQFRASFNRIGSNDRNFVTGGYYESTEIEIDIERASNMERQRQFVLILLLFVFALLVKASWAEPPSDILTISNTELGIAFVNSAEDLRGVTRIQRGIETGAKLDRFPLYWNNIEPVAGQFNWNNQDTALRSNEQQGLGTLAILLGTSQAYWPRGQRVPSQMTRVGDSRRLLLQEGREAFRSCDDAIRPPRDLNNKIFADGSDTPGPGKAINPANPWARFVEQAVARYKPGGTAQLNVRYWEVWNEPDLCHFWDGSAQEYARLLKVAYMVIKHVDPEATVMWAGFALFGSKYDGNADFLVEMVTAIRNDPDAASHNGFFDVAAVHNYSNVTNSYDNVMRIKNALAGTGWENKSIWVTESGVPVCGAFPGPDCPSNYRANPEEQAAYVWQNIAYSRLANNNGPIFHFQLHDDGGNECLPSPPADGFGLFTNEASSQCVPHNAQPRLAYNAYQLAGQYFPDTELLWADVHNGTIRRMAFYHPATKERRVLVWATDNRSGTAHVPATSDSGRLVSVDGSDVAVNHEALVYDFSVPGATNQNQPGDNSYTIGGKPYLLIEKDTYPPTATMNELFTLSQPTFNVRWEVTDRGSHVQPDSVTVLSQTENGEWQTWLSNQPATGSAFFTGEPGVRYRFSVQATDRAGNSNNLLLPLAETVINDGTQVASVSGQVLTTRGQPAAWARVSVGPATFLSNATGRFALNVPLGEWDVKVQNQVIRNGLSFMEDTPSLSLLLPPNNNPVVNGNFEQESSVSIPGWQPSGSSPLTREKIANTQENVLHLASTFVADPFVPGDNGQGSGGNSTISQQLTVPAGNPHLALTYKVESQETDGGNGSCGNPSVYHDKFEILIFKGSDPPNYILCQETGSDWRYAFFDLSDYAGQQITLTFNLYQSSAARQTSALIDLVTIGESPQLSPPKLIYLPLIAR